MGRTSATVELTPERRSGLAAYAAGVWSRSEARAACLELQDQHGQSSPLLLWRLWTIEQKRPVDTGVIESAVAATRRWENGVIRPLREARRRLKEPSPLIPNTVRENIREEVRAAELNAEIALLNALENMTSEPDERQDDSLSALLELSAIWGASAPMASLRRLAAAAL